MSKLALLPNAPVTPEILLQKILDERPTKVFAVIVNEKGEWLLMNTSDNSAAELSLAGSFIQHHALRMALEAVDGNDGK